MCRWSRQVRGKQVAVVKHRLVEPAGLRGSRKSVQKRKLIEVALPLEAINRESAREKSIRHGHPSTPAPPGSGAGADDRLTRAGATRAPLDVSA